MNPEIVEVVARAIYFDHVDLHGYPNGLPTWDELPDENTRSMGRGRNDWRSLAQAALTAARPAILEEAAGIVREWPSQVLTDGEQSERFQSGVHWACFHAATAIRAAGRKS